ncbi:MAG: hypothetical protein DRQ44_15015 [Gammaproteobacteria bacterium]|nr:MAG: hypothetical protein DRQ44_15015 [Gammaproteobacteria bacterium]
MKKKIAITLILLLLPVAFFIQITIVPRQLTIMPRPKGYSITTEKDPTFDQKIERILITASVEEQLESCFASPFEQSLVSALQENGVEAVYKRAGQEQEADASSFDATMRIDLEPLYRAQKEGCRAFIGTEFEATAIHTETGKQIWHATGKVDYLKSKYTKKLGYTPGGGRRNEFAWHTTAAIAQTFISEVNGQEPKPVYTTDDGREYHGQRID